MPAGLVGLVMVGFALMVQPSPGPELLPGPLPDSLDYGYGAAALLQGKYVVTWDGTPHVPRYPPGFSILLMPVVAVGGLNAAVWVPYAMAFGLAGLGALLVARLDCPLAAPIAAGLILFTPAVAHHAQLIMSDLPAATLLLLQVTLLAVGRGSGSLLLAGLVAGGLSWVRLAGVPLILAGLVAAGARKNGWHGLVWYGVGAGLPLLALGVWQLATFDSLFTTSYQAAGVGPRGGELAGFISLNYAFGGPEHGDSPELGGEAQLWGLPNAVQYPLQLLGLDAFLVLPGVGALGLLGLGWFAAQRGAAAVVGRFGLATVLLTLLVYVPYFWQSGRFLLMASPLLAVASAALLTRALARMSKLVRRSRALLPAART